MRIDHADDLTKSVAHRPWPLPRAPWVMAQRWSDLLFTHWPVPVDVVRALVPPSLALDLHDGTAWITVAPFYISGLRPRGLPALPWISAFPELNVRTYVTLGGKPGVYFFSLDAGSVLAVEGARLLYHLPYFYATMSTHETHDGAIHYRSRRRETAADFTARYRPVGDVVASAPGTLDHFLTERYCLYAVDRRARVYRADIHHRPWPLQPAEAQIERNTMTTAAGLALAGEPARLSFSRALDVLVWAPTLATS